MLSFVSLLFAVLSFVVFADVELPDDVVVFFEEPVFAEPFVVVLFPFVVFCVSVDVPANGFALPGLYS